MIEIHREPPETKLIRNFWSCHAWPSYEINTRQGHVPHKRNGFGGFRHLGSGFRRFLDEVLGKQDSSTV